MWASKDGNLRLQSINVNPAGTTIPNAGAETIILQTDTIYYDRAKINVVFLIFFVWGASAAGGDVLSISLRRGDKVTSTLITNSVVSGFPAGSSFPVMLQLNDIFDNTNGGLAGSPYTITVQNVGGSGAAGSAGDQAVTVLS